MRIQLSSNGRNVMHAHYSGHGSSVVEAATNVSKRCHGPFPQSRRRIAAISKIQRIPGGSGMGKYGVRENCSGVREPCHASPARSAANAHRPGHRVPRHSGSQGSTCDVAVMQFSQLGRLFSVALTGRADQGGNAAQRLSRGARKIRLRLITRVWPSCLVHSLLHV